MSKQTEAERLADDLQKYVLPCAGSEHWDTLAEATAELRRLVSFNNDLMDEVARLQKREWVGLTNNELQPIADEYRILFGSWAEDFARAIEAKLKEKNA